MKTARELADEFQQAAWNCKYGDGDVKELGDRLTAAIEAYRREWVEAAAKVAEEYCAKEFGHIETPWRIRALIPKEDSRG